MNVLCKNKIAGNKEMLLENVTLKLNSSQNGVERNFGGQIIDHFDCFLRSFAWHIDTCENQLYKYSIYSTVELLMEGKLMSWTQKLALYQVRRG